MGAPIEGGGDPRVGTTVAGRYFLHRLIGRGGMGDVYEATRLEDDRPVALKLLRAAGDEERVRRFEREAALAGRLRHPNCVEVVESGPDGAGGLFLAMELVRGRDLARVLADEGPLPAARAGRITRQVLGVLAAAHAAGVVHRDLKPANVMLEGGRDGAAKVLDFGIATFLEAAAGAPALTREGVAQGTPAYMSPEQIRGEPIDSRSDLYAVGALLFEMIAGKPPFEAPSPMAVAALQLTEPAPPLASRRPDVPPAVAALVARALERDRARRPSSAEAMLQALEAALAPVPEPATAPRRDPPPTEAFPTAAVPVPARRPSVLRLALLAAGVAAALAVTLARAPRSVRPPDALPAAPHVATAAESVPAPPPSPVVPARAPAPSTAPAHPPGPPRPRPPPSAGTVITAARTSTARAEPVSGPAIRLVRGELNAVPTPAAETGDGVLVLQAAPWAIVSVAGLPLGETPREVRLAAGSYEVRGVHPELGARVERVAVRAGERTLWSISFGD